MTPKIRKISFSALIFIMLRPKTKKGFMRGGTKPKLFFGVYRPTPNVMQMRLSEFQKNI